MPAGMWKLLCPMVLSLAVVVQAAQPDGSDEEASTAGVEFSPEVETILRETSDPDAYGKTERCISTRMIRDTQILDDRHVVFRLTSNRHYLVQFRHRCPRLQPNAAIVYETRNDQLCRLDQIRAANSLSTRDVGPPCSIPGFLPVQPQQIALLKESLKAKRKAEIEAYKAEKAEKKAAGREKAAEEG